MDIFHIFQNFSFSRYIFSMRKCLQLSKYVVDSMMSKIFSREEIYTKLNRIFIRYEMD